MDRQRAPTLLVSLLLHAIGIAALLTVRTSAPLRARYERVTSIASPYRRPPPANPKPVRPKLMENPPTIARVEIPPTIARAFRVPERLPQAPPARLAVAVPDLPSFHPADIPLPPAILDLPPRQVKDAGFSSPEKSIVPTVRPALAAATEGFDRAVAAGPAVARAPIVAGAFGDASIAAGGSRQKASSAPANFSAAEILSKPRPVYTDEARRLQIEGEVLLEVRFPAAGDARVLNMIRGLGHGLDENAMAAARAIRFRPARQDGTAVDSLAVIHILFQLAN